MIRHPRGQGQKIAGVHRNHDRAGLACEGEGRLVRRLAAEFGDDEGALRSVAQPVRDADQGFWAALVKEPIQRGALFGAAGPGAG